MTQHRRIVTFLAVGLILGNAVRFTAGEEPADATSTRLRKVPYNELSDRNVSRRGEDALRLKTVTWEHSETDHFIFHTETGYSVAQLASAAEMAYGAIKKDLGITQDSFERKCHIYVFLNPAVWQEFVRGCRLDARTGGWCTGRELFMVSRPHFKFQGSTLPHEITHLVVHRFVGGDTPLWLNEGLAEFEGIRFYRGYLKARDYILTNVPDQLDRSRYIPLKDLTSAVDYPRSAEEVAAFYIESFRLVAFLYHQNGGMTPLMKFIELQSKGARFESAWREVYGGRFGDLAAFEDKFLAFLTKEKP